MQSCRYSWTPSLPYRFFERKAGIKMRETAILVHLTILTAQLDVRSARTSPRCVDSHRTSDLENPCAHADSYRPFQQAGAYPLFDHARLLCAQWRLEHHMAVQSQSDKDPTSVCVRHGTVSRPKSQVRMYFCIST